MSKSNSHKCAAKGCKIDIPTSKLMCLPHWCGLPDEIRADVLQTYRHRRASDPDTVDAHLAACRSAMKFWIEQRAYALMSGNDAAK